MEQRCDEQGNSGEGQNSLLPSDENRARNGNISEHISQLPEDVLLNILSRLTMKEAARTSILSTRWRHLWTYYTGIMDFDASLTMWYLQLGLGSKSLDMERHSFVSWVNQVLRSHEGPTMEGLRICFDLDSDFMYEIDSWITIAMQKRVKRLEIDLTNIEPSIKTTGSYAFPSGLLNDSSFSSLKTLQLNMVDVTGEALQHLLLSWCPLLEVLSIVNSTSLVSLKVSGSSLKLKYLEMVCCNNLKYLEITAASLVSFKYYGPLIGLPFKSVPNLVDASFGGPFCQLTIENLYQFSLYILQLETLRFDVGSAYLMREFPTNFPILSNVKHLEVTTAVSAVAHCLFPCLSLLKGCPLLHRFTLKISCESTLVCRASQKVPEDHSHPCLKVVEVLGFQGNAAEVELVLYFLRNAAVLKNLIISPCAPCYLRSPSQLKFKETELYQSAKQHAVELGARVPPGVDFVVL
eukprot:XP_015571091.1 putative F-box/LRR-repeat protein At5g38386 [Ricinus communis]